MSSTVQPQPRTAAVQFSTRSLNVGVVSSAVNEHQQLIHRNLQGPIMQFWRAYFKQSKQESEKPVEDGKQKLSPLAIFQQKLKGVQAWTPHNVDKVARTILQWVPNRRFDLAKSLKTIVVGRTTLLASVAGHGDSNELNRVRVELPDVNAFLHNTLTLVAQELQRFPSFAYIDEHDKERDIDLKESKSRRLTETAINAAIMDLLPSDSLNSYLESSLSTTDHFDSSEDMSKYGFDKEGEGDGEGMTPAKEEAVKKNEEDETKKVKVKPPPPEEESKEDGKKHKKHKKHESSSDEDSSEGSGSESDE
jgi:hypothetical protein